MFGLADELRGDLFRCSVLPSSGRFTTADCLELALALCRSRMKTSLALRCWPQVNVTRARGAFYRHALRRAGWSVCRAAGASYLAGLTNPREGQISDLPERVLLKDVILVGGEYPTLHQVVQHSHLPCMRLFCETSRFAPGSDLLDVVAREGWTLYYVAERHPDVFGLVVVGPSGESGAIVDSLVANSNHFELLVDDSAPSVWR